MKKICGIVGVILSALLLTGGGNAGARGYVKVVGDSWYLVVPEYIPKAKDGMEGCCLFVPELRFDSLEEFVDTVKNQDFSEDQLSAAKYLFGPEEQNGFRICNMDKIYAPRLPSGMKINWVIWEGQNYSFYFSSENTRTTGVISVLNDDDIQADKMFSYQYRLKGFGAEVLEEIYDDGERTEVIFSNESGKYKWTTYAVERRMTDFDGRTVTAQCRIAARYCLQPYGKYIGFGKTGLRGVEMYVESDVLNYYICIDNFPPEMTDEWLSEFGLEAYRKNCGTNAPV